MRNKAENNSSRLKAVHAGKISAISGELRELRSSVRTADQMKVHFNDSGLHSGKVLISAEEINFTYGGENLWKENLNLEIRSGDRIVVKGLNGSGKTTLIKLLLGNLQPSAGKISGADFQWVYIDQEYSLIDRTMTVYEFVQQFNDRAMPEPEVKTLLARFLFGKETWDKNCGVLSGGNACAFCCAGSPSARNPPI